MGPPRAAWHRLIEHLGLNIFQTDALIDERDDLFNRARRSRYRTIHFHQDTILKPAMNDERCVMTDRIVDSNDEQCMLSNRRIRLSCPIYPPVQRSPLIIVLNDTDLGLCARFKFHVDDFNFSAGGNANGQGIERARRRSIQHFARCIIDTEVTGT
jgi:hypothetical protein